MVAMIAMVFIVSVSVTPAVPSRVIIGVFMTLYVMVIPDDYLLIIISLVSAVSFPVQLAMPVGFGLIHHHLIAPVNIVRPVSLRECRGKPPVAPIQVNELLSWHGIVDVDIRHIVIIHMIVPYRAPLGLGANIDVYAQLHLAMRLHCAYYTAHRQQNNH